MGGLGIFDEELCGDAAALVEEDGSGSDDGVDDGGGVVADGNELEITVVAEFELRGERVLELLEEELVVVEAERETECGVLHEVDTYPEFGERVEDGLEIVLGDEGEILGHDGEENLVILKDIERCLRQDGVEGADDGAFALGGDERLDEETDALVLERFDSFWVDDAGSVVGELNGLVVWYLRDTYGVGEEFRVGVEETVHILPNGETFGVETIGEDGGGVVAALAAEGGGEAVVVGGDKPLGYNEREASEGIGERLRIELGLRPIHVAVAVVVVGGDDRTDVDPLVGETQEVEIFADNGGRDEFAERNRLVVVEIVVRGRDEHLMTDAVEKGRNLGEYGVVRVWEESRHDVPVVVAQGLPERRLLIVGEDAGDELLELIGGFAHGGDDDDERGREMLLDD